MNKKKAKKVFNNKVLLVLGLILIVCFVLITITLFKYFYSGNNSSKYGDRLENINEHPLHKSLKKDIEALYAIDEMKEINIKTSGRIVYLTLDIANVITKEEAKSLTLKALDSFTEDEKGYYDIQFIVKCSNEQADGSGNKLYPILGYKNSSSSVVSWTNN